MENKDVIYENFPPEKLKTQVGFQKRSQTSRYVIVSLGLLCAILLAGNIGLIVIYVMNVSPGLQNNQMQANSDCEDGWTRFNGSCYIVSSGEKIWEESRNDCKDQGADLAIIKSKEEQAFINRMLRSGERAWIGFTNRLTKEWEWVDQTPISTTFWQPNKYGLFISYGLNCGELVQTSSNGYGNEAYCSTPKVWICEKNKMNKL